MAKRPFICLAYTRESTIRNQHEAMSQMMVVRFIIKEPHIYHIMHGIKLGKRKQYLQCFRSNNKGLREMLHRRSPFILTAEFRDMKLSNTLVPYSEQSRC